MPDQPPTPSTGAPRPMGHPPEGLQYLPEHPVDRELRLLGAHSSPESRLEALWTIYEVTTGHVLTRPPTDAERHAVRAWVITPDATGNEPFLSAPSEQRVSLLHEDVAAKASRLTQASCYTCTSDPDAIGPARVSFPIGIEPWTAQSSPDRVAVRQAVTAALQREGHHVLPWGDAPVCLSITALVPRHSRSHPRKDVDNLVKGLLDAMQGYLFRNDDAVQHLETRRLEYAGARGCYFVRAQSVATPDADVIYDDPTPPRLMVHQVQYTQPPTGPTATS